MTDVGILGLDTSHPEAFAAVLRDRPWEEFRADAPTVAAVWDDGTVRGDDYVDGFCEEWGAKRYASPSAMVDAVDAAMVLAVDWERHRPLARPFLEAGVPTLVDKPLAGSATDLDALADLAADAPLFGGSAVPFHPAVAGLPGEATDRTVHVAGYDDSFYYRVHTVDTARRVVGADWTRVTPWGPADVSAVEVTFADGSAATLRFDGPEESPAFGVLDVADRTRAVEVGADRDSLREMYEGYLARFLRAVDDGTGDAATVLDAARLLLAVEVALADRTAVEPGDDALATVDVPSGPFVDSYEPYY